ncbi:MULTISPECIES: NAD(P)-dependent oxidoreductase [Paenibacillus]|uniref:NAD(P)-dependent oxidoreductase n=1 Tax=Paenibacillus TaxID=44249 RepID=UPI0021F0DB7D|nr:NAD(P)-binding domain-containing protein [Paenibacillus sp. PSB04]UYO05420.1 NAD(P)-binding domain-containing protein [Paenibacillus sp. PSB04]
MRENKQGNPLGQEWKQTEGHLKPVSVIGLGMMGSALAQAFLKEGRRTTVWNRTPGRAETLAAEGAVSARTVAEAIAASPLILICVLDYAAVQEILEQAGDVLAGRTVVNLTNGSPAQARQTAAWTAEHGAEYLDGGIMAVPQMIGTSGAFVLYSGSSSAFEAWQPALEKLGGTKYLGGDPGLAPLYDLALLSVMYGMYGGLFHAIAMIRSVGVQAESFTPLVVPWLSAMSASMPRIAQAVDANDHRTDVSSLYINQTGFVNFIAASRELGISTELITPMQALIDRGVAEGHGTDGLTRIIEMIQHPLSD